MKLPIRVRLTASYLAVLVAMLITVTISVPVQLYNDLAGEADQSLHQRAEQLGAEYVKDGDTEFVEDANAATWGLLGGESWAQLLAPNGVLLNNSHRGLSIAPVFGTEMINSVLSGGTRLMTVELGSRHQSFRLIARPLGKPGRRAVLVLATALDSLEVVVRHVTELLILVGLIAVVLAGTSGWWLSRIALLPITRISRQAEHIHVDHLDERIPVPTSADELGHLAGTLNAMFDRLRDGVEQHRRLVADTSHELRTPLAIMRAELDLALTQPDLPESAALALEHNAAEVDRMSRIVTNLLTLARIDRGELELLRCPVDLRAEAITVVSRFRVLANAKQVLLQVEGAAQPIDADRERIDQVLSNLVDNAVKYIAAGTVRIQVWRVDGEVGVTIADTGPGIPREQARHIFDRFYRVDGARTRSGGGSGLGLAISQEIIRVHGGRIWLECEPGEGCRFSFALPAQPERLPCATAPVAAIPLSPPDA
ncbi:MAG: sensor histidine kinase [Pseudonocardiaceae bacterium]